MPSGRRTHKRRDRKSLRRVRKSLKNLRRRQRGGAFFPFFTPSPVPEITQEGALNALSKIDPNIKSSDTSIQQAAFKKILFSMFENQEPKIIDKYKFFYTTTGYGRLHTLDAWLTSSPNNKIVLFTITT